MSDNKLKLIIFIGIILVGIAFLGASYYLQSFAENEITAKFASFMCLCVGCLCVIVGIVTFFIRNDLEL